jgi:hypothetical protein
MKNLSHLATLASCMILSGPALWPARHGHCPHSIAPTLRYGESGFESNDVVDISVRRIPASLYSIWLSRVTITSYSFGTSKSYMSENGKSV